MAFECKAGVFSVPASTGNFAVTGVGFQPKAVIFLASRKNGDGSQASSYKAIGFAVSSSARAVSAYSSLDAQGSSDTTRGYFSIQCVRSQGSGDLYAADFVSMDADGFTVNFSDASAGSDDIVYLALGGSDLTNANVVNFTSPSTTGNQATTGAGFQPDCILLLGAFSSTDTTQNNIHFGFGAAISSSERATYGASHISGQGTSNPNQKQIVTKAFTLLNAATVLEEADFVSMDTDGFTLNWTTAHAATPQMAALCLKGGQYKIGVETQGTTTGTKATTGVGFTPTGLFLFGGNKPASASIVSDMRLSTGVASGPTERGCHWTGDLDAQDTTVCDSDLDTAAAFKHLTEGTPTLDAEADLDSFDADGFTLDWVAADATAREFVYLAFGSAAAAAAEEIAFVF